MQVGLVMDPLDHLKPCKDSSLAMIESAQRLGWTCFYFTPKHIHCQDGQAFAEVAEIELTDLSKPDWYKLSTSVDKPLAEFDVILMRKDPPFDLEYIYATYALELAEQQGVLVANKPQSLRDANEKFFTLQFPQCCPQTLVSKDIKRLKNFWQKNQDVIFKPLQAMGGNSVFHVDKRGTNLAVILEVLTQGESVMIMAQKYIPEIVKTGDKRILMINGDPIPYALARIPAEGDIRGNLAAGARGVVLPLTPRDYEICKQVGPVLRDKGLYFVGLDVIGDYLTEINVTSPTCIREIEKETSIDIATQYLEALQEIRKTRIASRPHTG